MKKVIIIACGLIQAVIISMAELVTCTMLVNYVADKTGYYGLWNRYFLLLPDVLWARSWCVFVTWKNVLEMIKTFLKMLVAAIAAMGLACALIAYDATGNAIIVSYLCVAIGVAAVLGAFDVQERKERKADKKTLPQNYRKVA